MDFKKYVLLMVLIGFISISSVSAGLFGFGNGECDLFKIDCPEGYHNAGELDYNESLFLSTASHERPYYAFRVESIGISQDNFTDFEKEGTIVESTIKSDDFEAYKTIENNGVHYSDDNTTYMFYHDGNYEYELKMWHDGCPYDDAQFKKDVDLLNGVAHSIKRK